MTPEIKSKIDVLKIELANVVLKIEKIQSNNNSVVIYLDTLFDLGANKKLLIKQIKDLEK